VLRNATTIDVRIPELVTGDMGIGGIHQGEAGGATDNDPYTTNTHTTRTELTTEQIG